MGSMGKSTVNMRFSAIIPTLNRCDMLADALLSVRTQSFPDNEYEIIVVDNGSTDGTRELVERLNQDGGKPIRYVYESRPGLHWARHAGARAAQGEVLAYTDDDAVAHPDWLKELARAYTELDADCAGGKILIRWDQEPPAWVIRYEDVLGRLDYGPEMRLLEPDQYINGGNFSIKRERLYETGGFNPDQVGDYLLGDGESGLCQKIHQAGWRMAWVPDALIWHRQTVDRNGTLSDMKRRFANNGVCGAYGYCRGTRCRKRHLLRRAAQTALRALDRKLRALKHRSAQDSAYYRHELDAAHLWGQSHYYLRLVWDAGLRELVLREDWINESAER
jgi:glycosyltransferase involved in cell wall biosynthesis